MRSIETAKEMGVGSSRPAARGLIISFDALGDALPLPRARRQSISLCCAKSAVLKANISAEKLKSSFRTAFKSVNAEHPNYGKETLESPEAWWTELVNRTFRDVVKGEKLPDDLGSSLYEHFSSTAAYELYPDVQAFFSSACMSFERNWTAEKPTTASYSSASSRTPILAYGGCWRA